MGSIEKTAEQTAVTAAAGPEGEKTSAAEKRAKSEPPKAPAELKLETIPLEKLKPSPTNPRKRFNDEDLAELAASLAARGQLQPILARAGKGGGFEIVVGERRWRAAKLAKLPALQAIVRELSDVEVLHLQIIENLQREDVNAVEEADGYYQLIKKAGYTKKFMGKDVPDVARIAKEVGKSESYIYQRLQLVEKCTKPVVDAVLDGLLTATHAVEIARLQVGDQMKALRFCLRGQHWNSWSIDSGVVALKKPESIASVDALVTWIKQEIQHALSGAPWQKDDAKLCPAAGACNLCSKRSDYLVSPEKATGQSQCMDPNCYGEKKKAFVKVKEAELKQAQGVVIKFASDHNDNRGDEKVLSEHDVREVKPNARGAVLALDISTGKTKHVLPEDYSKEAKRQIETAKRTDPETGKAEAKPATPLKEREKALAQRRVAWINDHLREKVIPKTELPAFIEATGDGWGVRLIQLAAAFGTSRNATNQGYSRPQNPWAQMVKWTGEKKTEGVSKGSGIELWGLIRPVLQQRLEYYRVGDVEPREAQNTATLIGVKWADLEKLSVEALPEPKGWAAERGEQKAAPMPLAKKQDKPKAKKAAKARK